MVRRLTLRDEAEILAAEAAADIHPEGRDVQRLLIEGAADCPNYYIGGVCSSLMLVTGVIEMVHGHEAVLQAEAQAQMLQGRKDLVDDSHVSPRSNRFLCRQCPCTQVVAGCFSRTECLCAPASNF